MSEININEVKQQLREVARNYRRPMRGKFAVLAPFKEEIVELSRRGAASGDIASILAQFQVAVSKDTVARFLREETRKDRATHGKKTGIEPQTSATEGAATRPMMPRGLPVSH